MKSGRKFFTLVEILAAVAIVGILTALGFGTYSFAMNSARESSSKALIQQIGTALEAAQVKEGYFPSTVPTSSSTGTSQFVNIEVTFNTDGTVDAISINSNDLQPDFQREFVRVVDWESFSKFVKNGEVQDAWGGTVYYCYPGKINTTSYDLISPGADMKFGDGQAATPPDSLSQYRDTTTGEPNCDDITNF